MPSRLNSSSDEQAKYLPHWQCIYCGFRVFTSELDLCEQVCGCGKGEGSWGVVNGHLLKWAETEVPNA